MIRISHLQARRLIRAQADQVHLPEEQWTALYAHLEDCSECQAYRSRLLHQERSLRRVLRQRWDPVDISSSVSASSLARWFLKVKAFRQVGQWMLGGAAAFLLIVVIFVGWSVWRKSTMQVSPQPAGAVDLRTPERSPTPTRVPSTYRGVIAYEYRPDHDVPSGGEIYLLNTGTEPVNLTNHPADDRAPAWSPDGEWLAFLSDRAGKDEVFVLNISGTRLTQLTDLPEVHWRGGLSWSPDGQMLSALGERKLGESTRSWVYLIPLDGSNGYPLGQSAGALRAEFSPHPDSRLLAVANRENQHSSLVLYNFDPQDEQFHPVDLVEWYSPAQRYLETTEVDLFDWSLDGSRILYQSRTIFQWRDGEPAIIRTELRGLNIRLVPDVYDLPGQVLIRNPDAVNFAGLSLTGIKSEVAYLVEDEKTSCRMLRLVLTSWTDTGASQRRTIQDLREQDIGGLCIEEGLRHANWRQKEKSVLVTGYEPGREAERGLYAVRFRGEEIQIDWLADARGMVGSPLLRPAAARLAVDPQPVQAASLPPSPLPGPEVGDLLAVSAMNERTLINRLAPDGSESRIINQSIGSNACPVWSPGRDRIAFLSDRSSEPAGAYEIYIMDGSGLNARRAAGPEIAAALNQENLADVHYTCPRWSPDGRWLASLVSAPQGWLAAVIPVDEQDGKPRFFNPTADLTSLAFGRLAWLPDGRLLAVISGMGDAYLRIYDPQALSSGQEAQYSQIKLDLSSTYLMEFLVSPDGRTLVMSAVERDYDGTLSASLQMVDLTSAANPGTAIVEAPLVPTIIDQFSLRPDYPAAEWLHWLPDGRVAYILRHPAGRRAKAEVWAATTGGSRLPERIASIPDTLMHAAWSEDGQWLSFVTEAGRYVIQMTAEQEVTPTRVGDTMERELSW